MGAPQRDEEQALRERAEADSAQRSQEAVSSDRFQPVTRDDYERVFEELRIHQIELQVQNAELRRAQLAVKESRDRFADLYDFAPVGYLALGVDGVIQEANFALSRMLGVQRAALVNVPFSKFVHADGLPSYRRHLKAMAAASGSRASEFPLMVSDGGQFWAQVKTVSVGGYSDRLLRTVVSDISDRKKAEQELEQLATLDPLTETYNRRGFETRFKAEISRAKRSGARCAALLIDCDDFKSVNEAFGHATGDAVLRAVAARLQDAARATDLIARIGGDEFLVLLPDTRLAEATIIAERLRLAVAERKVATRDQVGVTVSIGLITVPSEADSLEKILHLARFALQESKSQGKDRVSTKVSSMLEPLCRGDALSVRWQPIVQLKDETVVGFELLSRGPPGPFHEPTDFLGCARRTGELTRLDLACLRKCLGAAFGLAGLRPDLVLYANIMPSTLLTVPTDQLLGILRPNGRPGGTICLEISEQEFAGSSVQLVSRITALKDAGILIAVDDVYAVAGTVDNVLLLEPDIIKLDRSVVHGVADDASKQRLIRRSLALADALHVQLVAEGVELRQDADVLREMGVKQSQGFLWSEPVAPQMGFEIAPERTGTRPSLSKQRRDPARVLIVDDEPMLSRVLTRMLPTRNISVADGGDTAIDLCKRHEFDLVLCDIQMPGMDGIAVYHELRSLASRCADRVVFMTAFQPSEATQAFLKTVPNELFLKPFDRDRLNALVDRYTAKRFSEEHERQQV